MGAETGVAHLDSRGRGHKQEYRLQRRILSKNDYVFPLLILKHVFTYLFAYCIYLFIIWCVYCIQDLYRYCVPVKEILFYFQFSS